MKKLLILIILAGLCYYIYNIAKPDVPQDYNKLKASFHTQLIKQTKAPQDYLPLYDAPGVKKILYPSGKYQLQALLSTVNIDTTKRKAAVVYLHAGFALGASDIADCQSFINEDYIVMAPSYRAENGNDGKFELFMGEVDDAKAAVKWLAKQSYVDSTRIYVIGHSIGGGIASMLSLQKDLPVKYTASIGGLYNGEFKGWEQIVPFDINNQTEKKMRVLVENVWFMKLPHIAFFGDQDSTFTADLDYYGQLTKGTKLRIEKVRGNHLECLQPAINRFISLVKAGEL